MLWSLFKCMIWLRRTGLAVIISSFLYRNGKLMIQVPNNFPYKQNFEKDSNLLQDQSHISKWSASSVRMEIYGKIKQWCRFSPECILHHQKENLFSRRRRFNGIPTVSEFSSRHQQQNDHLNSALVKKLLKKPFV